MDLSDWFLTPSERGNTSTTIDLRNDARCAWTDGNHVDVLIDGASYFDHLLDAACELARGDLLALTDWQGDADDG